MILIYELVHIPRCIPFYPSIPVDLLSCTTYRPRQCIYLGSSLKLGIHIDRTVSANLLTDKCRAPSPFCQDPSIAFYVPVTSRDRE